MKTLILIASPLLLQIGCAEERKPQESTASAAESVLTKEQAIKMIRERGGRVTFFKDNPANQVDVVNLMGCRFSDGDLKLVKWIPKVRHLYLRLTQVSDEGLADLKGLQDLENLMLGMTAVTDAGLVHLKHMAGLKVLDLRKCDITDAAIPLLIEMKQLGYVDLKETRITPAGLKKLKAARPKLILL